MRGAIVLGDHGNETSAGSTRHKARGSAPEKAYYGWANQDAQGFPVAHVSWLFVHRHVFCNTHPLASFASWLTPTLTSPRWRDRTCAWAVQQKQGQRHEKQKKQETGSPRDPLGYAQHVLSCLNFLLQEREKRRPTCPKWCKLGKPPSSLPPDMFFCCYPHGYFEWASLALDLTLRIVFGGLDRSKIIFLRLFFLLVFFGFLLPSQSDDVFAAGLTQRRRAKHGAASDQYAP